jgi:transcriptional regulator with XRE-family HTH domain
MTRQTRTLKSWQWVRDEVIADASLPVGVRIKAIRVAMRLTQRQLAARIGAGETALSGWEQGKAEPWPIYLYRLAQTFGCSMDDLYAAGAAWQPYPLPPHRSDAVPCRGVQQAERYRGQPCSRWTRHPSGHCPWHRESLEATG